MKITTASLCAFLLACLLIVAFGKLSKAETSESTGIGKYQLVRLNDNGAALLNTVTGQIWERGFALDPQDKKTIVVWSPAKQYETTEEFKKWYSGTAQNAERH